jgi:ATP-dependent exoDNAse (exonuclease V) alpha subunit
LKARVPVIRFATAQAFKGMESPVVVLCDVDAVNESQSQALLYVAMSRARSHLTVLVDEQTKPAIRECLRKKLQGEAKR